MIFKSNNFLTPGILLLATFCFGQKQFEPELKGTIKNYVHQQVQLYKCFEDTLLFVDSVRTDHDGKFNFIYQPESKNLSGILKVILRGNQYFYILCDGKPIVIQTVFYHDVFSNIASDSLKILVSAENKQFYEFQRLQQQVNIAHGWLLQMVRLYPLTDPFHQQIEKEYFKRYKAMELFVKKQQSQNSIEGRFQIHSGFITKAYYQPVLPDWKNPDPDRNKIIAEHFFDYFNPSENFYLHTNILPEKLNDWFVIHFKNGETPQENEKNMLQAAETFLGKMKDAENQHAPIFAFTLNYILKKMNKEHLYDAILYLYDRYLKTETGKCNPSGTTFNWVREKVDLLRNIQIGTVAPDFDIEKGMIRMSSLQSEYILIIFWASWCPHCLDLLPKIQKEIARLNQKRTEPIRVISISLDESEEKWKNFIQKGNYSSWLNISELKGWNGEVPKLFNVFATPTMFLLDKEKKIIARPQNIEQLLQNFND